MRASKRRRKISDQVFNNQKLAQSPNCTHTHTHTHTTQTQFSHWPSQRFPLLLFFFFFFFVFYIFFYFPLFFTNTYKQTNKQTHTHAHTNLGVHPLAALARLLQCPCNDLALHVDQHGAGDRQGRVARDAEEAAAVCGILRVQGVEQLQANLWCGEGGEWEGKGVSRLGGRGKGGVEAIATTGSGSAGDK